MKIDIVSGWEVVCNQNGEVKHVYLAKVIESGRIYYSILETAYSFVPQNGTNAQEEARDILKEVGFSFLR